MVTCVLLVKVLIYNLFYIEFTSKNYELIEMAKSVIFGLEFSSHSLYHVLFFMYLGSTSWYIVLLGVLPFISVLGEVGRSIPGDAHA
jgi:hypothetical protein